MVVQANKQLKLDIVSGVRIKAEESGFLELCNILLDNANKYCDVGGDISITFVPDKKFKKVSLVVGNTYAKGEGINYNKFFERFYRNDKSRNSEKKALELDCPWRKAWLKYLMGN